MTNVELQRLQAAILAVEMVEKNGDRFTVEELSPLLVQPLEG